MEHVEEGEASMKHYDIGFWAAKIFKEYWTPGRSEGKSTNK